MEQAAVTDPSQSPKGQEFRADTRRVGLPPALVKELTRIDPVKSTLAVVQTYGLLALIIGTALYFSTWWAIVPAVFLIAVQQHALFVLAHDAAHYRLFKTRWLNDAVGRFSGMIAGISMCAYRVVHRLHHNHLYGPQDMDTPIHGGYPRGRVYLLKKLGKDLIGLTAPKTFGYFFGAPVQNVEQLHPSRPLDDTSPELRRAAIVDRWMMVGVQIALPVLFFIIGFGNGYGWQYWVLWVLPLATVLQPILRFRAICEHGAVAVTDDALRGARTNLPPLWMRWLFPHHVNYHIEHHLYPSIPHYNLPRAHRELAARGLLDDAEVCRLGETVRKVFAEKRKKPAAAAA